MPRADLVELCRLLNTAGARYVVVGGFAIRAAGFIRNTMDVDLLVDTSLENEARLRTALGQLPDNAIHELQPGDLDRHGVIRVADEFCVDLMKAGCGVTYAEAIASADIKTVAGVAIPFASPAMLWRMKQTVREKDEADRIFLRRLLAASGTVVSNASADPTTEASVWQRVWRMLTGR